MSNDLQIRRLNSRIISVNSLLVARINDIIIEHDGFTLPEEIARATAAETEIQTNLNFELMRAKGIEAENRAAIRAEEARAMSVEFLTNSNLEAANLSISNEITRATAADTTIDLRITAEIAAEVTRASVEEAATALDILTEESRALAAEAVMRADIVGLKQEDLNIRAGGEQLSTNISQETARAMTAENSIQTTQGTHATSISSLRDEMDQSILDRITYAFQVTSSFNANQTMTANVVSKFNLIEYCTPAGSFNTSNYQYIIPIDGIYSFSIKLFINSTDEKNFRMGIYLNETLKLHGGASAETSETMTCVLRCEMGQIVYVACVSSSGPVNVYMAPVHSVFNGFRIGNFV